MLQKQDIPRNAALRLAHAVWPLAGAVPGGRPKKRALARSLCDLTPVREMSQGKSGVSSSVEDRGDPSGNRVAIAKPGSAPTKVLV